MIKKFKNSLLIKILTMRIVNREYICYSVSKLDIVSIFSGFSRD